MKHCQIVVTITFIIFITNKNFIFHQHSILHHNTLQPMLELTLTKFLRILTHFVKFSKICVVFTNFHSAFQNLRFAEWFL